MGTKFLYDEIKSGIRFIENPTSVSKDAITIGSQMIVANPRNAQGYIKRYANTNYLKKTLWGDKLLADAQKLLRNSRIRALK
jgi:hypothetical protein